MPDLTWALALEEIGKDAALKSLLYDFGLLPEQVLVADKREIAEAQMLRVVAAFMAGRETQKERDAKSCQNYGKELLAAPERDLDGYR